MDTQLHANDFDSFYAFLSALRANEIPSLSPEESVQKFRESQQKLRRFQELNDVASKQSLQGLSKPICVDELLERVEQRVAQQGLVK